MRAILLLEIPFFLHIRLKFQVQVHHVVSQFGLPGNMRPTVEIKVKIKIGTNKVRVKNS